MTVVYDERADALRIVLRHAAVEYSDQATPDVVLDFDGDGRLVGLEVRNASAHTCDPRALVHAVVG
jgi:uncharacterized protein YuzE